MKFIDLIVRVKSYLRDESSSAFQEYDVKYFINEGIDRIKQIIKQFELMEHLSNDADVPILLPTSYHHLLALYSASRCFAQDERHYQATSLMNEFEVKVSDLFDMITNGEIIIVDKYCYEVDSDYKNEYVFDNYFNKKNYDKDSRDEVL